VPDLLSSDDSARRDSRSTKIQLVVGVLTHAAVNGGWKDIAWLPIRSAIFLFV
jgi:hypothetical protein